MDSDDSSPTPACQYHMSSPDVAAAADEAVAYAPDVVTTFDTQQLQLPLFWNYAAELWFGHAEAVMHAHRIRSEMQRASLVIDALDDDSMRAVANLLGPTLTYQALKDRLIAMFGTVAPALPRPPASPPRPRSLSLLQSQPQRQHQFQQQQLDQRMPSQWLYDLRRTMPDSTTDSLIRSFWMMRLTPAVRGAMTELDGPLDRLAACADHVMAMTMHQEQQTQQRQQQQQQQFGCDWQTDAERIRTLETTMVMLSDQITALTTVVRGLQQNRSSSPRTDHGRTRTRSRSPSKSKAHSPARSASAESSSNTRFQRRGWCYYHLRYGNEARQCRQPCTYTPPLQQ